MPHISIKAEPLFAFLGIVVTNSLLTTFLMIAVFLFISLVFYKESKKPYSNRARFFFAFYYIQRTLYNFLTTILGKKTDVLFSFLSSLFFFILLQNWLGLLPGIGSIVVTTKIAEESHIVPLFRGGTADLNTTLALGFISVFAIQYFGIKFLGFFEYVKKFINFENITQFLVGILEIISEISKIVSFSFRLFGNIFAGEVLLTVIAFLVPILASFPFLILEVFVGFIQALIFLLLTAVFINSAVSESHV